MTIHHLVHINQTADQRIIQAIANEALQTVASVQRNIIMIHTMMVMMMTDTTAMIMMRIGDVLVWKLILE